MGRQKSTIADSAGRQAEKVQALCGLIFNNERGKATSLAAELDGAYGLSGNTAKRDEKKNYELRVQIADRLLGSRLADDLSTKIFTIGTVVSNIFYFNDMGLIGISRDGLDVPDKIKVYMLVGDPDRKERLRSAITGLGLGMDYIRDRPTAICWPGNAPDFLGLVKRKADSAGVKLRFYSAAQEELRNNPGSRMSLSKLHTMYHERDHAAIIRYAGSFGIKLTRDEIDSVYIQRKPRTADIDRNSRSYAENLNLQLREKSEAVIGHLLKREWPKAAKLAEELDTLMLHHRRSEHTMEWDRIREHIISSAASNVEVSPKGTSLGIIVSNMELLVSYGIVDLRSEPKNGDAAKRISSVHLSDNPVSKRLLVECLGRVAGMGRDDFRANPGALGNPTPLLCALLFIEEKARQQGKPLRFYDSKVLGMNLRVDQHVKLSLSTIHSNSAQTKSIGLVDYLQGYGIKCSEQEYEAFKRDLLARMGIKSKLVKKREG
ncbi:MAG: hypothetical protein KGH98_00790 [Candidatus Micrarchaeota archaeon]|nr:hypothetical protein [Candidatus Micrarchaeota archaeon]